MNYYEFKIVMKANVGDINENLLDKFWQVYSYFYKIHGNFITNVLDILIFMYKKNKFLDIEELKALTSIMLKAKYDFYLSSSNDSPIFFFFMEEDLKYKNINNINLCMEYIIELRNKNIPLSVKKDFAFNFYKYTTIQDFNQEQLLDMVEMHFYLHESLENVVYMNLITNAVTDCFVSKIDVDFVDKCSWCVGNILTGFQNNYYDLAYELKRIVDENLVDREDINKYFVLGVLSKKIKEKEIDYFSDEMIEGQRYFLSKGNDLLDTAESISDYIQDERYQEINVDFILGIIKEGLLLKEEKLLIKN